MFNRKSILLMLVMSFGSTAWAAPSITVGKVTGKAGSEAIIPISFDPGGTQVSAAQFSLVLPSELTSGTVTLGASASSSGKLVTAKQQGDHLNVIVMGMNQTPMDTGVLANATVKISSSAKPGKLSVKIEHTVYSDGAGKSIAAGSSKGGSVKVSAD